MADGDGNGGPRATPARAARERVSDGARGRSRAQALARLARRGVALFASLELSCVLLLLLGLLTWLGTLEQVEHGLYQVQKRYFESYVLVHRAGPVPIPLPGGHLVLSLLAVNLVVGGVLRLRRRRANLGVLATHLGMLLLLAAGFVKLHHAQDGHVTLFEGQSAAHFQSHHRWELALVERLPDGRAREHLVPQEHFLHARDGRAVDLRAPGLPVTVRVDAVLENCVARPADAVTVADAAPAPPGPVVDGVELLPLPRERESERNVAGARVTLLADDGGVATGLLWGHARAPFAATLAGRELSVGLRRERYPMPFTLTLDDFHKQDHPGTGMPRWFSSDVRVADAGGERAVRISMNEPLRAGGLVLYQASWGPANAPPGSPLFSTLAVVRNPADQWPLVACVVIALGMGGHFAWALVRRLRRREARA